MVSKAKLFELMQLKIEFEWKMEACVIRYKKQVVVQIVVQIKKGFQA